MTCHICLTREGTDLIKCRVCCDGMEQDACVECAAVYRQFRTFKVPFSMLQVRRAEGIEALRLQGIASLKRVREDK